MDLFLWKQISDESRENSGPANTLWCYKIRFLLQIPFWYNSFSHCCYSLHRPTLQLKESFSLGHGHVKVLITHPLTQLYLKTGMYWPSIAYHRCSRDTKTVFHYPFSNSFWRLTLEKTSLLLSLSLLRALLQYHAELFGYLNYLTII